MASERLFLSHAWAKDKLGRDNHERVARLNDGLRARKVATWFDAQGDMAKNALPAMTDGIDNSSAVAIFVTREYVEKAISTNKRIARQSAMERAVRLSGHMTHFLANQKERLSHGIAEETPKAPARRKKAQQRRLMSRLAQGPKHREVAARYGTAQAEIVLKVVDTASTFCPLLSSTADRVATLDVLLAFATVSVSAPFPYVRPKLLKTVNFALSSCTKVMSTLRQ